MRKIIVCLIVFTLLIVLSGCIGSDTNTGEQTNKKEETSTTTEVPEALGKINKSIEEVIKKLENPTAVQSSSGGEKSSSGEDKSSGDGQQSKDKSSNSEDSNSGQSSQNSDTKTQSTGTEKKQPSAPVNKFDIIMPIITNIHYLWNTFEPQALQNHAKIELINKFSNTLNNLTNLAVNKNEIDIYIEANNLYGYLPEFYSLFGKNNEASIKILKYLTRSIMFNVKKNDWVMAEKDFQNLASNWNLSKSKSNKENIDKENKFNFAILEIENVLKQKNQNLLDIKCKVAVSNLEDIEDSNK